MTIARTIRTTHAVLAAAALVGAALVFAALANLHPAYGVAAATIAAVSVLWWWRGVFSRRRVLLWMEERLPELRYALVAIVDEPHTRVRDRLEARVRDAPIGRALGVAGLRLVGIPLALLLLSQFVLRPLIERAAATGNSFWAGPVGGSGTRGSATSTSFRARVTPPGYTRSSARTIDNPTSIAALVGSDLRIDGRFAAHTTMPSRATVLRLESGDLRRMVALEPRLDSAPRVVLDLPARDTVMRAARGDLPLSASVRDDIGITSAWFEVIITSGSGERFTFRNAVLSRTAVKGASAYALTGALRMDSLRLEPGDIVHLRAVARDANPAAEAVAGSSETRTLRVYRAGESDSVAVEAAPPPEVRKSELSQRMLIIMTEKLTAQVRRFARGTVMSESRSIGMEQSRLRKRVGQIIFTRLTGEEGSDEDATAALADTLSPTEALLKAASDATGGDSATTLEEGEDAPVVAVNRPLLEAFNAMWEAERRLGVGEPREALPHMRAALAAIQKARAAERLYLRGRPPKIVLDVGRIRLTGKKEGIDPGARTARPSAVTDDVARKARFDAALTLLTRDPSAAVDTLTLMRVDALSESPALAAALDVAIADLRSGADATTSLRAVRRLLAGAPQQRPTSRWSGVW